MQVKELIKELEGMDQGADVFHLWDGALRTSIECVYMGKTGICVTADSKMVAYSDEARPLSAPDAKEDKYWETPKEGGRRKTIYRLAEQIAVCVEDGSQGVVLTVDQSKQLLKLLSESK